MAEDRSRSPMNMGVTDNGLVETSRTRSNEHRKLNSNSGSGDSSSQRRDGENDISDGIAPPPYKRLDRPDTSSSQGDDTILHSIDSGQHNTSKTERAYMKNLNSKFVISYNDLEEKSERSSESEDESIQKLPSSKKLEDEIVKEADQEVAKQSDLEDPNEQPKWIIRESGTIRIYWDVVIIVFAIYTSILTPFTIAFSPTWENNVGLAVIDWIINIFFIIDIGINFRTTYINTKTGKEIWSPKKIARHYLIGGKFWIDLLSSIPFDGFNVRSLNSLGAIGMLKLIRTARISKIIQHLDVHQLTKTYLKTLQLLFNLLLYIHLLACIWWLIVNVEQTWIPNMDFIFYSTTIYRQDLWTQYWSSMYHSVMIFGVNEMAARTTFLLSCSCFIMLFSAMVNANIIGQVAVLIGDMSKKSVKFQQQQDTANTAMTNLQIPRSTKKKVREYLLNTQSTQDQQEELTGFLKNISPSLRFKVSVHIFADVLKTNCVFRELLEKYDQNTVIPFIVRKLEIMLTIPEKEIVKQDCMLSGDEKETCMYFIAKGEFKVYVQSQVHSMPAKVRKLQIGDHFGEIAMLHKCKRSATVTSSKYGTLGYICRTDFKELQMKYQEITDNLHKGIYSYDDDLKLFTEWAIRQVPYFKMLSQESVHNIIFGLKTETLEKGHKLILEEDLTDKLIIVQYGVIDIEIKVDGHSFVVERLFKGGILNYRNFIYKTSFKLVARCKSITQIMYLEDTMLDSLRAKNEDIEKEFTQFKELEENSEENIDKLILDYIMPLPAEDIRPVELKRRRVDLTTVFKNAAIKKLILNKESKPPSLKSILKMAIEKMINAERNKNVEEESEDSGEGEEDEHYQTNFLRDAASEIAMYAGYTSDMIHEFEVKLKNL